MTNPVYEFTLTDGTPAGVGTALEFEFHGMAADGMLLGKVLGHEPDSEDDRRRKVWGVSVEVVS